MKTKVNSKDFLNKIVTVKMDRPIGAHHPKRDFIYPINYGFIPNTISGDGEELDAYVIGPIEPLDEFVGRCCAIIHRTNDDDDKLIVVPPKGKDIDDATIEKITEFQEKYYTHIIIRTR
jgi:inorganic pyrophosphatase